MNNWQSMPSKILDCTCKNAFQDNVYGPGRRVHNPFAKGYKCAVCGDKKLRD